MTWLIRSAGIPFTVAIAAAGWLPLLAEVSIDDALDEWLSRFYCPSSTVTSYTPVTPSTIVQ